MHKHFSEVISKGGKKWTKEKRKKKDVVDRIRCFVF